MPNEDLFLRLAVATAGGLLLGLDREIRGIAAGIRTHGMVSLSAAVITVSALLLYYELGADRDSAIDPLRVVQGLAQAIGFIAAGAIFVSRGDVRNLTTASNLWLSAAVGISAGAGQFMLTIAAIVLGVLLLTVFKLVEHFLPGSDKPNSAGR